MVVGGMRADRKAVAHRSIHNCESMIFMRFSDRFVVPTSAPPPFATNEGPLVR